MKRSALHKQHRSLTFLLPAHSSPARVASNSCSSPLGFIPCHNMAEGLPPRPGVVMFDRSAEQAFYNSNFTATGRDTVTVNVAVATAGQAPSLPIQERRSRVSDPSLISRFLRVFRRNTRQSYNRDQASRDAEVSSPPALPVPSPPSRPHLSDVAVLSDGSSLSFIDRPSKSPQPRSSASNEEEVYERSFLPKGQGHPMYNPSPLGASVKLGDIGIITQDGFQSFGNLYVPRDQNKFSIDPPPDCDVVHQSEKFQEGQTFVTGMEDAKRPTNEIKGMDPISTFEFHCRQDQGAVLAIPSSAQLDTLSPLSTNELRKYLCDQGIRLMMHLRDKHYLDPGQSLYVATGAIKSDSWGIAVHTSPMREPYNHIVLARRTGKGSGAFTDTYGWTSKGNADARYGVSSSVDNDGRRTKDQSLFLRGFLITPSTNLKPPITSGRRRGLICR
ncbi:hypothetical protein BKA70DRAFT_7230 [Coprinopsis sp. MPI-PUGE-AT-0042]|nr:hypothetical protein BKA70DRAFT_7230 [Coprinopsis sp. MPI-PUGE-AT-0042]